MTRPAQKESERRILDELLTAIGITPNDYDIRPGERPDFMLTVSGRTVGVEVTMYQSGTTIGAGAGQRPVEAEWEFLRQASRTFQSAHANISDINVGLMFYGVVPVRRQHQEFIKEVADFIRGHAR